MMRSEDFIQKSAARTVSVCVTTTKHFELGWYRMVRFCSGASGVMNEKHDKAPQRTRLRVLT